MNVIMWSVSDKQQISWKKISQGPMAVNCVAMFPPGSALQHGSEYVWSPHTEPQLPALTPHKRAHTGPPAASAVYKLHSECQSLCCNDYQHKPLSRKKVPYTYAYLVPQQGCRICMLRKSMELIDSDPFCTECIPTLCHLHLSDRL